MRLAQFSGRVSDVAVPRFLRLGGAALVGVVGVLAGGAAEASDPSSIYVVPTAVEQTSSLPMRVIIHGAFFRLTNATAFTYGQPECGYMYFACRAGEDNMCQMQWNELKTRPATAPMTCAGFGTFNVISAATVRAEGTPLGTPDTWDLGMGISTGSHVDGKCPLAHALACPRPGGVDAGATGGVAGTGGASGSGGGGAGSGGVGSGGAGSGGAGSGGATSTGGGAATGGASASGGSGSGGITAGPVDGGGGTDAGTGSGAKPSSSRGCSVSGEDPASTVLSATLLALLGVTLARARRNTHRT